MLTKFIGFDWRYCNPETSPIPPSTGSAIDICLDQYKLRYNFKEYTLGFKHGNYGPRKPSITLTYTRTFRNKDMKSCYYEATPVFRSCFVYKVRKTFLIKVSQTVQTEKTILSLELFSALIFFKKFNQLFMQAKYKCTLLLGLVQKKPCTRYHHYIFLFPSNCCQQTSTIVPRQV